MNLDIVCSRKDGITLIEILIVILVVALLAMMIPVPGPRAKEKAKNVVCLSNLRQDALAVALFMDDKSGRLPWQVPTNEGGSLELLDGKKVSPHWLTLANYIKDSRLLVCMTDPQKVKASVFSQLSDSNVSYFLNLDVSPTNSSSVLAGDRHLQIGGVPVSDGFCFVRPDMDWSKKLHSRFWPQGVLAFGDGHAEIVRKNLGEVFSRASLSNRLQIP